MSSLLNEYSNTLSSEWVPKDNSNTEGISLQSSTNSRQTATTLPDVNSVTNKFSTDFHRYVSSEVLFAISLVFCGMVGAAIAVLRNDQLENGNNNSNLIKIASVDVVKFIFLGLGTGFTSYLAIKGGKFLFTITTINEDISMNPYGSAFFALLAGLFSERFFSMMKRILDDIEKRVMDNNVRS